MKRSVAMLLGSLLVLVSVSSCRKELCYNHDEHALKVRLNMVSEWEQEWERNAGKDWERRWRGVLGFGYDEVRPDSAEGIRARVFTEGVLEGESNIAPEGGFVGMTPGTHDILFYNNDTEYITFHDTESTATAVASTRTRTRSTYNSRYAEEVTVNAPDQLYGAYMQGIEAERTLEEVKVPFQMRPLVYSYIVHFMFKNGLEYVALARGALSGMAEGVYLQTGRTTDEVATILFDDCIVDQNMGVYAKVLSFGVPSEEPLPDGPHSGHEFRLNLEVRLKNGKILSFDYDVTDQLSQQPRGGIVVVQDIEISDEDGQEGSGGFDVDVEGWGDYEDIELPLN